MTWSHAHASWILGGLGILLAVLVLAFLVRMVRAVRARRGSYAEFRVQDSDLEIARASNLYRVSWHSKGRRDPNEIDLVILFQRPFDARHIVAREKGGEALRISVWYVDRRFAHFTLHAPARFFSVAIT